MKKLLLLLATVSAIFTACEGGLDNEENGGAPFTPKIEFSQQNIEVEFESAQYSVSVTSPCSWEATSKNDWIEIETASGIAGTETLKFSVLRNEEEQERKGTIVLKNTDYNLVAELYVIQKASAPYITIGVESLTFATEGGEQEVTITSNIEYEWSTNADWLTIEESEKGLKVSVPNYVEIENRTAEIAISNEKYGIAKTILVIQNGGTAEAMILYTSSDGSIVTPYMSDVFGANIVSNTYGNGLGVILFDAPVTSIGDHAFWECTSLTSVTIPDSVTSIGDYAFAYCSSLTSVTIPDSVTSIGDYAFAYCSSLTSVTIPDSVTSIGVGAFGGCTSLTSITIPDSVTSIGDEAFYECTSLTSVTIPDSVTSIGDNAFKGCTSLKAFYGKFASADNRYLIIDGVLNSFAIGCGATEYTIPDSVTSIGSGAFYNCTSLTSITIPDSVTSIGDFAFTECTSLASVTIGNSVASIGEGAFSDCYSLTSITIPDSVTSIGEYAFTWCTSLTSVTIPDSVTEIEHGAFLGCTSLTSITIPDSVTSIGNDAFESCTSLTNVTIPDSVASIGEAAFAGCTSLTSITIPDSVTSIGNYAFYYCPSLKAFYGKFASADNRCLIVDGVLHSFAIGCGATEYTIPDSVTSIGTQVFYKCTSLASITIPDSVTSIGYVAFYNCTSLKSVYCKATTPPAGGGSMFLINASGRTIYVPRESVSAYKSASGWSDYKNYIVGYDF